MIAESYICISGERAGEIEWFSAIDHRYVDSFGEYHTKGVRWRVYADFERQKLRELGVVGGFVQILSAGLTVEISKAGSTRAKRYWADELIGYDKDSYGDDTESNRLLKRAEFLKAVCEREGLEW